MLDKQCCICSQINGWEENDLLHSLLGEMPYQRRIAVESRLFAVIPSLGPLVRGHVLLCPKSHYKSLACLPEEYDMEYSHAKTAIAQLIGQLYHRPIHCFEHGSDPNSSRVLCTVSHAHLHLVPTSVEVLDVLLAEGSWMEFTGSLAEMRDVVGSKEYIYYESPSRRHLVTVGDLKGIPSQYMRRVFAEALGNRTCWNWRDGPRVRETLQTLEDVRSIVSCREHALKTGSML